MDCATQQIKPNPDTSNPRGLAFVKDCHLPNLLRISCCSSREEKRILGLRPLVWKPSQGGVLVLGLSLGSTSMSKLTWNKSGYFSWMSQASKSYLTGEQVDGKDNVMKEEFIKNKQTNGRQIGNLKLWGNWISQNCVHTWQTWQWSHFWGQNLCGTGSETSSWMPSETQQYRI